MIHFFGDVKNTIFAVQAHSNISSQDIDKQGTLLVGPIALWNFFGVEEYNGGDPIVMYDQLADRFFVSQIGPSTNSLIIAVSTTADPTGSYYVYEYSFDFFPDYPHYSIWHNGYYLSISETNGNVQISDSEREIYVLERQAILEGQEDPLIISFPISEAVSSPVAIFSAGLANLTGIQFPEDSPGFICYLQDDAWSNSISQDHLKIWQVYIDWDNVNASSISVPQELALDDFNSIK